jgi:hypothetical protein
MIASSRRYQPAPVEPWRGDGEALAVACEWMFMELDSGTGWFEETLRSVRSLLWNRWTRPRKRGLCGHADCTIARFGSIFAVKSFN